MSTSRGRAYAEGKIKFESYDLMYLLKGMNELPTGDRETIMLILALKHGYTIPDILLDVNFRYKISKYFELNHRF